MVKEDYNVKAIYAPSDDTIILNITSIWDSAVDEDHFIDIFNYIYSHELIHREISKIIGKDHSASVMEEKAVTIMLNYPWNDDIEQVYEELYGGNL